MSAFGRLPSLSRAWAFASALVAVTLLAYLPSIRGGFIWDDEQYVTGNLAVQSVDGIGRIWLQPWTTPQYYPLTLTSFWLEYRLWGLNPAGFRLTNVLLHCASALLLWKLLRRLSMPGAWLTAALFALHPVHVESVAWITERKNVLSGFFFFLSLLAWFRFAPPDDDRRGPARSWAASFVLFVCALLSKSVASVLPAVALLIVWWKRGTIRLRDFVALAPFFLVGAAAGSWTGWLEKHRVGAWGPDWDLSWSERVFVAGRAVWFYAAKLIWPRPLVFIYPRFRIDTASVAASLFPLSVLAVLAVFWHLRNRVGRGPLTAALYFAGVLVPALSFVNVFPMLYSFVADHFQYLASVGPLAAAGAWLGRGFPGPSESRLGLSRLKLAAGVLWLVSLAVLTHQRAPVFADVERLWRDTLAKNPGAWMARSNLASLLHTRAAEPRVTDDERARLLAEAEAGYRGTLDERPENLPSRVNLARLLEDRGDFEAAEREYRAATDAPERYPPGSRGFLQRGDAWFHYGRFLEARGRTSEAESAYRKAVEVHPAFDLALATLGSLLLREGRADEARPWLEEALRVNPRLVPALNNFASLVAADGKLDEAVGLWRRAVEIDPLFALAHANLGSALLMKGDLEGAAASLYRAIELDPDLPTAQRDLAECQRRLRVR